jgi:hypothetical protein
MATLKDIDSIYVNGKNIPIVAGTLTYSYDFGKSKSQPITMNGQNRVIQYRADEENMQEVKFEVPAYVDGVDILEMLRQTTEGRLTNNITIKNELTGKTLNFRDCSFSENPEFNTTDKKAAIAFSGKEIV